MSQLPQSNATVAEFRQILFQLSGIMNDHIPLAVLVHLALDSWLDEKSHTFAGQSDDDAFDHVVSKLKLMKANKMYVPRALTSSKLNMQTLKTYCIMTIFARSFGIAWTQSVYHDDHKIRPLFQNSYKTFIRTREIVHAFVEYLTGIPLALIQSHVVISVNEDNTRNQKYYQEIVQLRHEAQSLKDSTQAIILANFYQGEKLSFRKKSKSSIDNENVTHPIVDDGVDIDIGLEDNDEKHSVEVETDTAVPVGDKMSHSVEAAKVSQPSVNSSEYILNLLKYPEYVLQWNQIEDQIKFPFDPSNFKMCKPKPILSYITGKLLLYFHEVSHYRTDENILTAQQFDRLCELIKYNAIKSLYLILRVPRPKVVHNYYLAQAKWLFKRLHIDPQYANNIVDTQLKINPQENSFVVFPFNENLDGTDGIKPFPITLEPPPSPKILSRRDSKTASHTQSSSISQSSTKSSTVEISAHGISAVLYKNDVPSVAPSENMATSLVTGAGDVDASPLAIKLDTGALADVDSSLIPSKGSQPREPVKTPPILGLSGGSTTKTGRPQKAPLSRHSVLSHGLQFDLPSSSLAPAPVPSDVASALLSQSGMHTVKTMPSSTSPKSHHALSINPHVNLIGNVDDDNTVSTVIPTDQQQVDKLSKVMKLVTRLQLQLSHHKLYSEQLEARMNELVNSSRRHSVNDQNEHKHEREHKSDEYDANSHSSRVHDDKPHKSPPKMSIRGGGPPPGDDPPSDSGDTSSVASSHRRRRRRRRKNKKNKHNTHDHQNSRANTVEMARKIEQKALIQAQVKEQIKNKMDTIKNSFTARFHGYPNNKSSESTQVFQKVCKEAIAFVVQVLMWFTIHVNPNINIYTEAMAINKVANHLQSQAKHQFQLHESASNLKITTLNQFVMYLLKQYIKRQQMPQLKKAILSEMPLS